MQMFFCFKSLFVGHKMCPTFSQCMCTGGIKFPPHTCVSGILDHNHSIFNESNRLLRCYVRYARFVRVTCLDSGQHACGGHTEVQVGQHLGCRGLINVRRPLSGEIILEKREVDFSFFLKSHTFAVLQLALLFAVGNEL